MTPSMRAELINIAMVSDLSCFRALDKLASPAGAMKMNLTEDIGAYDDLIGDLQRSRPAGYRQKVLAASSSREKLKFQLEKMATAPPVDVASSHSKCQQCSCPIPDKSTKACPKCGSKLSGLFSPKDEKGKLRDGGKAPMEDNSSLGDGDPGAEAAVDEELTQGSFADSGKFAGILKTITTKGSEALAAAKKAAGDQFGADNVETGVKHLNTAATAATLGGSLYAGNEVRKVVKTASARRGFNPVLNIRNKKSRKPSEAIGRFKDSTKRFSRRGLAKAR